MITLCFYIASISREPQRDFENIFFISHFKKPVRSIKEGLLPGRELDSEADNLPPDFLKSSPVSSFIMRAKDLHDPGTKG